MKKKSYHDCPREYRKNYRKMVREGILDGLCAFIYIFALTVIMFSLS